MRDREAMDDFVPAVIGSSFGEIDVLVNNAGLARDGLIAY